jgi:methylphosphotriester-DNA--protein-cysteine methyltransferase
VGIIGPRLESYRIPVLPNSTYIGVRFLPGATGAAIGVEGSKLRDYVGLLDMVAPGLAFGFRGSLRPATTLNEAVPELSAVVRQWSAGRTPPDEIVQAAVAAISMSAGTARVAQITEKIGLSERQFLRRFQKAVGLTPKQFARVVRFRAAAVDVAMRDAKNWGEVAAQRGYSDQSHLVRDFAQILGMTPTEFKRVFAPGIEHVDVR